MTFLELAKAAMPGATDEQADYALWNHTPFPFETSPRVLYKRIAGYRRACANGIRQCETCYRPANGDDWNCERCNQILREASSA